MMTIQQLRDVCERCQSTLIQDIAGVAALGVMLIVALHLPAFG